MTLHEQLALVEKFLQDKDVPCRADFKLEVFYIQVGYHEFEISDYEFKFQLEEAINYYNQDQL